MKIVANPQGYVLPILLVLVTMVMTFLLYGLSQYGSTFQNEINQQHHIAQIVQYNLLSLLQDQQAWDATFAQPAFDCVRNSTCLATQSPRDFSVLDSSGQPYHTNGTPMNSNGTRCAVSDPPLRGACTITYRMRWNPLCNSNTDCLNPQIVYTGTLVATPGNRLYINPDKYNFTGIRP